MPWMNRIGWKVRTYLSLVRFEHTLFSLPMALSGMLLGEPQPSLYDLGWVLAAMLGARTAAMALNRWIDRDIDALNPRTANRELPLGHVSSRETLMVILGSYALYQISASLLSAWCGYLAPIPAIVFVVYPYLKRWTWLCHLGLGLAQAFSPLGGFLAVTKTPASAWSHPHLTDVILLGGFAMLWVGSFDIYYGVLDIDFDRAHGIHSIPARFGSRGARLTALVGHLVAGCMIGWILFNKTPHPPLSLLLGFALLMGLFISEFFLVRKGHIETAFFQINIAVGALVLLLIYLSAVVI